MCTNQKNTSQDLQSQFEANRHDERKHHTLNRIRDKKVLQISETCSIEYDSSIVSQV